MRRRSFEVVALAVGVAVLGGCSAAATPGGPSVTGEVHESDEAVVARTDRLTAAASGTVTRSAVIANAQEWVTAQLAYCQSPNGQADPDTSCAATCSRESNPLWDPYRSDCSGFVSWAWELPAPGLTTADFAPYETSASTTIQCADMLPGDAANRDPDSGHIVLFVAWVTPGTEATFMEEPGCSAAKPYANEFTSAVTCSGSSVDIAYEGTTFEAIRYVNILDDPDAGAVAEDAGVGTGTGEGEADAGSPSAQSDAGAGSTSSTGTGAPAAPPAMSEDAGATQGASAASSGGVGNAGHGGGTSALGLGASPAACAVSPHGDAGTWGAWVMAAIALTAAGRRRRSQRG